MASRFSWMGPGGPGCKLRKKREKLTQKKKIRTYFALSRKKSKKDINFKREWKHSLERTWTFHLQPGQSTQEKSPTWYIKGWYMYWLRKSQTASYTILADQTIIHNSKYTTFIIIAWNPWVMFIPIWSATVLCFNFQTSTMNFNFFFFFWQEENLNQISDCLQRGHFHIKLIHKIWSTALCCPNLSLHNIRRGEAFLIEIWPLTGSNH